MHLGRVKDQTSAEEASGIWLSLRARFRKEKRDLREPSLQQGDCTGWRSLGQSPWMEKCVGPRL